MSDIPTLREEVDRKALNALAMLQSDKTNFRISEETYQYVVRVLWEAFAGVADREFMSILEQMDAEPYLRSNQTLFTKKDYHENHYVLLDVDTKNFRINVIKNGECIRLISCKSATVMKSCLRVFSSSLEKNGYTKYSRIQQIT